jgi:hypothetical protein
VFPENAKASFLSWAYLISGQIQVVVEIVIVDHEHE